MRPADPAPRSAPAHILLAHGSRDPQWPAAIQAVAARIQALDSAVRVRCAYLELAQPNLAAAIAELIAEGAQTIAVWPMLLGLGRHARADLPRLIAAAQTQIQARHPDITIVLQPAIAEHAPVLDAMAQVILGGAAAVPAQKICKPNQ
ncbi:MAG: CbiX/SirB N-terminal domain-containing protein [Burkholderiaceae bacterium]|jgi:sirohydrochlorin cobaltochelatase|nr:CbiX/SirB N-terminal domain-containing protein [Burkholderiaceae bacterium]